MYRPLFKNFISLGVVTGASSTTTQRNTNSQSDAIEVEDIHATGVSSSYCSLNAEGSLEEQISDSISTCTAPTPSLMKKAIATAQLNDKDIDIAINNVFSRPDLLEPFVAPHVNCSGMEHSEVEIACTEKKIYKAVKSLLADPLLLEDVCSHLYTAHAATGDRKKCTSEMEHVQHEEADEHTFQMGNIGHIMHHANVWESICESHGCCLCLDVLACPVISNCSHAFCGECIGPKGI